MNAAAIARAALRAYDLDVVECEFAAHAFNTVFRVDVADGTQYACGSARSCASTRTVARNWRRPG